MTATPRARSPKGKPEPASVAPYARVCVDVPLAHLDRPFDYLIPRDLCDELTTGCRVRVRFAGQLVDGYVLERTDHSDLPPAKLAFVQRLVSPEPVLSAAMAQLCRAVADRYGGMLIDVLRLAIPARHARAEKLKDPPVAPATDAPDPTGWSPYPRGRALVDALASGQRVRAVWQAVAGEDWPRRMAELAATVAARDEATIIVLPDHRDVARVAESCADIIGDASIAVLAADLGPEARYKRWLAVRRGQVRVVIGTRSTIFAPVDHPGLVIVWDDGDDLHAEPRSPYPHVREVAVLRAHLGGASLLIGGFARTAEAHLLVRSGWAHDVIADRATVRAAAPRVTALDEHSGQEAGDSAARAARLPWEALRTARAALANGAPVLVQVPRRGYVPALACGTCRAPARCRHCAGPLALPQSGTAAASPTCRWCGTAEAGFRCGACGSPRLRAIVIGAKRTAEELGRAFAPYPVRTSGAGEVLSTVGPQAALVVSTPGAEPVADGGYGAALLLDGWALLGRADLRASEETLRRWMTAAALVRPAAQGGRVMVTTETAVPTVQALVRWDPLWHAEAELDARVELGFPPAVRVATVDGEPAAVNALLDSWELPERAEILGPVEVAARTPVERALIRIPRSAGRLLSTAVHDAQANRSARKDPAVLRFRVDPLDLL